MSRSGQRLASRNGLGRASLVPAIPVAADLVVAGLLSLVGCQGQVARRSGGEHGHLETEGEPDERASQARRKLGRVLALFGVGEPDETIAACTEMIELDPECIGAYVSRGGALEQKGDYDGAAKDYVRALELDPRSARGYTRLSLLQVCRGNVEKAIADFSKTIALEPDMPFGYTERGIFRARKGEFDLALKDCNRALEIDPDMARAYSARGTVYALKWDWARAAADLDRALEIDPHNWQSYANRAWLGFRWGVYERAEEDFRIAICLARLRDRGPAYVWCIRGSALLERGAYESALPCFAKAVELNPHYVDAYKGRAAVREHKGDHDRAAQDYTRVIELLPQDSDTYLRRGLVYLEVGRYDEAIADLDRTIELAPRHAKAYCARGIARMRIGEARARQDFLKAIELDPDGEASRLAREKLESLEH